MNLKYLKIGALSITALLFSGCASGMTDVVKKPLSEITKNKKSSYITFARPRLLGAAYSNTILEFNPITKDTNLVGILGGNNKVIYKMKPGTHYFYMAGGENDDMIKVTTSSSKMYYVITQAQFGFAVARFNFKPLKASTEKILKMLPTLECNDELFSKYKFYKQDEENSLDMQEQYKSDLLNVSINCFGGKVSNINNMISSIDEAKETEHIVPNEKGYENYRVNKKEYISEIEEDYDEWLKDDSQKTELKKKMV